MRIIPTSTTIPSYTQVTQIAGRNLRLSFDWNARLGRWRLAIYEAETGRLLRGGITLVDGWDVIRREVGDALRDLAIAAIDISGSGKDPGLSELGIGARSQLYSAELEEEKPSAPHITVSA